MIASWAPLAAAQAPLASWADADGRWQAVALLSAVESRVGCIAGALNVQTCGPEGGLRQAELAIETLWRRARGGSAEPAAAPSTRAATEPRWRVSLTRNRVMLRFEQRF